MKSVSWSIVVINVNVLQYVLRQITSFTPRQVNSWGENSKMAVAEPKSSCVAAVRMDAWPMIGVIWPWRCCQKMKAHGKWQLFVVSIYSGMRIGSTFSPGQAYRSGISILALFISPSLDRLKLRFLVQIQCFTLCTKARFYATVT